MKIAAYSTAGLAALGLALSACTTVYQSSPPAKSHPASSAAPSSRSSSAAPHTASPQAAPPAAQPASPNVTDPWAVVSAYYGDIESGDYQQAWALLDSGATTGQTYQSFVNGFACTGSQEVSEVSATGDQVTFDLTADDACNGQVQHFSGTDTVQDGKIVAADITQD
jgi:curli biogenesis system outer membrane secretion channel CsgG